MDKNEKAAGFSFAGSCSAIFGGLWLLASVLGGGFGWQGAAIAMMIAYMLKGHAYWILAERKSEKLDTRTLEDFRA
jgi:Na+-driven multidrug efflux pump